MRKEGIFPFTSTFQSLSPVPRFLSTYPPSLPVPFLPKPTNPSTPYAKLESTPLTASPRHVSRAVRSAGVRLSPRRVALAARLLASRGSWRRALLLVHWAARRDQSRVDRKVLTTLIAALGWRYPDAVLQAMRLMMKGAHVAHRCTGLALPRCGAASHATHDGTHATNDASLRRSPDHSRTSLSAHASLRSIFHFHPPHFSSLPPYPPTALPIHAVPSTALLSLAALHQSQPSTWPDLPAYRAAAVALGRAGYLQELLQVGGERMGLGNCSATRLLLVLHALTKSGAAGGSWLASDVVVYNAVSAAAAPHVPAPSRYPLPSCTHSLQVGCSGQQQLAGVRRGGVQRAGSSSWLASDVVVYNAVSAAAAPHVPAPSRYPLPSCTHSLQVGCSGQQQLAGVRRGGVQRAGSSSWLASDVVVYNAVSAAAAPHVPAPSRYPLPSCTHSLQVGCSGQQQLAGVRRGGVQRAGSSSWLASDVVVYNAVSAAAAPHVPAPSRYPLPSCTHSLQVGCSGQQQLAGVRRGGVQRAGSSSWLASDVVVYNAVSAAAAPHVPAPSRYPLPSCTHSLQVGCSGQQQLAGVRRGGVQRAGSSSWLASDVVVYNAVSAAAAPHVPAPSRYPLPSCTHSLQVGCSGQQQLAGVRRGGVQRAGSSSWLASDVVVYNAVSAAAAPHVPAPSRYPLPSCTHSLQVGCSGQQQLAGVRRGGVQRAGSSSWLASDVVVYNAVSAAAAPHVPAPSRYPLPSCTHSLQVGCSGQQQLAGVRRGGVQRAGSSSWLASDVVVYNAVSAAAAPHVPAPSRYPLPSCTHSLQVGCSGQQQLAGVRRGGVQRAGSSSWLASDVVVYNAVSAAAAPHVPAPSRYPLPSCTHSLQVGCSGQQQLAGVRRGGVQRAGSSSWLASDVVVYNAVSAAAAPHVPAPSRYPLPSCTHSLQVGCSGQQQLAGVRRGGVQRAGSSSWLASDVVVYNAVSAAAAPHVPAPSRYPLPSCTHSLQVGCSGQQQLAGVRRGGVQRAGSSSWLASDVVVYNAVSAAAAPHVPAPSRYPLPSCTHSLQVGCSGQQQLAGVRRGGVQRAGSSSWLASDVVVYNAVSAAAAPHVPAPSRYPLPSCTHSLQVGCSGQQQLAGVRRGGVQRAGSSSWLASDVVVYNAVSAAAAPHVPHPQPLVAFPHPPPPIVLNACGTKRQWKGVQWVLQQMRSEGVAPDAATFGLAIQALSLCSQTHLALHLLADMEAAGFPPTTHTYRDLVRALAAAGRVEEAEAAVREMQERGMEGNAGVFYSLACALCSAGRWRDAVTLVEKISRAEDAQPPVVTWTGLIRACERSNRLDDAAQVFREMQVQGCTPNITTCNIMITVFARTGRFAAAEEIYAAARSGGRPIITGRKRWMSKEERQEARMQRLVANNRSRRRLIREGKLQRGGGVKEGATVVGAWEAGEGGREEGAREDEEGEEDALEGGDGEGEAIGVTGESEEQKSKEEEGGNGEGDGEEDGEESAGERVWFGRRREDPPLVPNSRTFSAMLGACVRCRQWQAVRQVARDMQRAGWALQVRQHGWVVDALLKGKQTVIADELLLAMRGTATGAAGLSNSQESSRVSVHNPGHVASRDYGGVGGEEIPPETVESVSEEEQRRTAAQQQLDLLSALTRASSRGDGMSSQGVSDDSCDNNSLSSSDSSSSSSSSSNSSISDTSSSTQASSSSGKDSSSDELSPVLLRVWELLESHAPLDGFAWRYAVASVGGGLTGAGVEEAVGVMDAWGRALEGKALDERVVEERALEGTALEERVVEGRALEGKVVEERAVEVEVVSGEGRSGAVAGAYSAGVESGRAESSGVETASVQRGPARAADARTDLDTAASGAGAAASGSAASGAVGAAGAAGDPGAAGAAGGGASAASSATPEAYPASSPAVDPGVLADLVRGLLIGGKMEEVRVALRLVDRMEKEGWVADAGIYTSLLHRTVRLGMGAEAREVLARAEAAGVKVEYDELELSDSVGGSAGEVGERVGGGWLRGERDRVEEPSAWDILKVWRKELQ
ncbi:unnamed protein product [Closterium sp. Naga37s-1]|nr:unnamed protein product [Closterium sp. Naga37s-1]